MLSTGVASRMKIVLGAIIDKILALENMNTGTPHLGPNSSAIHMISES